MYRIVKSLYHVSKNSNITLYVDYTSIITFKNNKDINFENVISKMKTKVNINMFSP